MLQLLSSPSYMPQRKRGLAKALGIDDEEYRAFKDLLDEMANDGTIAELKKGKWGLPLPGAKHTPHAGINLKKINLPATMKTTTSIRPGCLPRQSAGKSASERNLKVGRIDVKRGGMAYLQAIRPATICSLRRRTWAGR